MSKLKGYGLDLRACNNKILNYTGNQYKRGRG